MHNKPRATIRARLLHHAPARDPWEAEEHTPGFVRSHRMTQKADVGLVTSPETADLLLDAWRTNNRVTTYLIERLPAELWTVSLPGAPRRTFGTMASHIHNARCRWVRTLGSEFGVMVPPMVDARRATRRQVVTALRQSSRGILALLRIGSEHGGSIPPTAAYTWRNLPLDVAHVLCYFVAHEGHHRGQLVLAARALGARLPAEVTNGLWQWNKRSVEGNAAR